jgi:hypothetical protein
VNKKQFWKTFALGEELDIAGRFIYNGLRFFHETRIIHHPLRVSILSVWRAVRKLLLAGRRFSVHKAPFPPWANRGPEVDAIRD